ncbi:hypothetical protein [Streptomyces sp. NBC_01589]
MRRAVLVAEPVILAADDAGRAEIRRWLTEHVHDFTSHQEAS